MNFKELQEHTKSIKSLLFLEDIIPHYSREKLKTLLYSLTLFFLFIVCFMYFNPSLAGSLYFSQIRGIFLILFSFSLKISLSEAYFYSLYFKNYLNSSGISFTVLSTVYFSHEEDITKGFLTSFYGEKIMERLGLSQSEINSFLKERINALAHENFEIKNDELINLSAYAEAVFNCDKEFQEFLFKKSIQLDELKGASLWEENRIEEKMNKERWWSRENLGRTPGIGKDWAFGQTNRLTKFGRDITEEEKGKSTRESSMLQNEVDKVEAVLSREREANALIISDDEGSKMSIVSLLSERINSGKVFPELEHKKVFLLDTNALIDSGEDKTHFEIKLTELLNEAVYAENIILVFPNFTGFLTSARTLGSDIGNLLSPYLHSSALQFIALSSLHEYHEQIEANIALSQVFEVIDIKEKGDDSLIRYVEEEANILEKEHGIFFTYQSIEAVVSGAHKYYEGETMSDKTIDLLLEMVPYASKHSIYPIKKEDVLKLIESKTGIPTGEVKNEEKDKLLHLEDILHERIVGQEMAVNAISQAMRRSRSGVGNSNKPIGSFLFLGPTGVGKTETTKALKDVFFGPTAPILRLDMSEYTTNDALSKLIGSYEGGKSGVLSSLVKEHPYGVLLLDEFEKSTMEVKNLFLQILDEGFFSDMRGMRVNLKNLIIIATSNAGSETIFNLVKIGADLSNKKEFIINEIISEGLFKPELLNRFDGVIVFHPLEEKHLREVASLMLGSLQKRLKEKGIGLAINDSLVDFLISKGTDPKFGARPMNRAISDEIEARVAEEIIKGTISSGSRISLTQNSEGRLDVSH